MKHHLVLLLVAFQCFLVASCKTSENNSGAELLAANTKTKQVKPKALQGAIDLANKFVREGKPECRFSSNTNSDGTMTLTLMDPTAEVATMKVPRDASLNLTSSKTSSSQWSLRYELNGTAFYLAHGVVDKGEVLDVLEINGGYDRVYCSVHKKGSWWDILDDGDGGLF